MRITVPDRDLLHLEPEFRALVQAVLEQVNRESRHPSGSRKFYEIDHWDLCEGYRSPARQEWLYASGRTRRGPIVTHVRAATGLHPCAVAADIVPVLDNGEFTWGVSMHAWRLLGHCARTHDLHWGGDWHRFQDLPHCEASWLRSRGKTFVAEHEDLW